MTAPARARHALQPALCIAGLGGFGIAHHRSAWALEQEGLLRVLATCDIRRDQLSVAMRQLRLAERGVDALDDFDEMLARYSHASSWISVATPISCHAGMHAASMRHGLGCYLEKPPTLDPEELEAMIDAEAAAPWRSEVGFGYIGQAWRQDLKRRILDGEFGRVQRLAFLGVWGRDRAYYRRSAWAGRLALEGRLVVDSCFGNAMSHHVHNLLFFAGTGGLLDWAEIDYVECEMYRLHPIETADTVFSRATTVDGIELRVAMSHAVPGSDARIEIIECEKATIRNVPFQYLEISPRGGKAIRQPLFAEEDLLQAAFRRYAAYVGGRVARPLNTLQDCRPLVHWNALNFLAARQIHNLVPPVPVAAGGGPDGAAPVPGLDAALQAFIAEGIFPSQAGRPWAAPGGGSGLLPPARLSAGLKAMARLGATPGQQPVVV